MTNTRRDEFTTRDALLKSLTDQEISSVSTAETTETLPEGDEYVELDHLERGVLRAHGSVPRTGNVLPRRAVLDATWDKIVNGLSPTSP